MNTADSDLIQTVIPDSRIRLGSAQQAHLPRWGSPRGSPWVGQLRNLTRNLNTIAGVLFSDCIKWCDDDDDDDNNDCDEEEVSFIY